jgi:hypothetical protein
MIPIHHIEQHFNSEVAFLVLCCRVQLERADSKELAAYLRQHQLDWDFTHRLTGYHGIRPIAYKVAAAHPQHMDHGYTNTLRKQSIAIAKENLERLREIAAITGAFRRKDILIVPYKGILLSQLLFDDYALRESSDIDMLILPKDFSAARRLFMELGYTDAQYYNEDFEDYFIKTNREFKFSKTVGERRKMKVELQWNPLHKLMGIPLSNDQLFYDLREIEIPSGSVNALSPSNELLLLLAHHGVADVWRKLKHIVDIAVFIDKYRDKIDWLALEQTLTRNKLQKFALAGCQMAELLFGVTNPVFKSHHPDVGGKMLPATLGFPLLSTEKTNFRHLRRHLALCDTMADRASLLWRYAILWLMPNMRDIKIIKLPKSLFSLYFIVRRFRFLQSAAAGKKS